MPTDWDQVRSRIAQRNRALDDNGYPQDEASLRAILERRAKTLAATTRLDASEKDAPARQREIDVLELQFGGVRYGFALSFVSEVLPFSPLTPLPATPDFVLGIVLARGRVISCVDLMSFLKLPVSQLTDPSAIVVLSDGDMEIGVLTEELGGVVRCVPLDSGEQQRFVGKGQRLLRGMTESGAFVLDAAALLADPDLVVEP